MFERDDCGGDGEKQKVEEEEELEVGEGSKEEREEEGEEKSEVGIMREDPALTERSSRGLGREESPLVGVEKLMEFPLVLKLMEWRIL